MSGAPVFTTLGCRLNAYETEAMKDLAAQAGVRNALEDHCFLNTAFVIYKGLDNDGSFDSRFLRDFRIAHISLNGFVAADGHWRLIVGDEAYHRTLIRWWRGGLP